ncbi:MAG TPA: tyrosine-type recombinase/integrase [Candidatus Angelobacter sp.]|nr:tyrosine-type recombinase/integrase [Candidatus Angelobacter sp.]
MSLVLVPDRIQLLEDVLLNGVSNANTRRAYSRALQSFLEWYRAKGAGELSRSVMREYRAWLEGARGSASTVNQELSALRRMFRNAAAAGFVDRERAADAAGVENARASGVRAGNWLTPEQARKLLLAPDENTLKGKRDRALLAVLVGCGLRREELVLLDLDGVQLREDRWVIPELVGKGKRVRLVPVPGWVKERLDAWTTAGEIRERRIFRAVKKNGTVSSESLSATAVWKIVLQHARNAGIKQLTPHDLRRTCAKLCRRAGGDIEQIQFLLGHSSIQTTEKYLGGEQEIKKAVNDRLFARTKI